MKLTIESPKSVWVAGDEVIVRVVALNDSFAPVDLDRALVIGPNGFSPSANRSFPVAIEPRPTTAITLQPFTSYGRERRYTSLPPGRYVFYAYLLRQSSTELRTEGPLDTSILDIAAAPLTLQIVENPIIVNLSVAIT